MRRRRIAGGLTLTQVAREAGLDPANLSRLERDLVPPPLAETSLARLAAALGIHAGGSDWHVLLDLSAAARGRLPGDLRRATNLPDVFTRLRQEQRELRDLRPNPRRTYSLADALEELLSVRSKLREEGERIAGLHVITTDGRRILIDPIRDGQEPAEPGRGRRRKRGENFL